MIEFGQSEPNAKLCECGLDMTAITDRKPNIQVECYHDGTLGLSLHRDEATVQVHPGDSLEVVWRLTYPKDGAPPRLYEVSNVENPEDPFGQFRPEGNISESDIPDSFEPVVGYRGWTITDDDLLKSTAHNHTWSPDGPEVAVCQQQRDGHHVSLELFRLRQQTESTTFSEPERAAIRARIDQAIMNARRSPERNCQCGIYAVDRPELVLERVGEQARMVYGRVKGFGKIAEYSEGFRAEKAQIDCLFEPKNWKLRRRVRRVAKKYGVPVEKPNFDTGGSADKLPLIQAGFWTGVGVFGAIGAVISERPAIGAGSGVVLYFFAVVLSTSLVDWWKGRK